jgi:hypothetical protein
MKKAKNTIQIVTSVPEFSTNFKTINSTAKDVQIASASSAVQTRCLFQKLIRRLYTGSVTSVTLS